MTQFSYRKFSLFILMFFILMGYTNGQETGTVTGFVNDMTGKSLPGAHVFIKDGKGTLTDAGGRYELVLDEGEYLLNAQFIGYVPSERNIRIEKNQTLEVNFRLSESIKILDEVVVSAEKTEQKVTDVNVSMAILKPEKIEKVSSSSLEAALVQMPGFEILDGQPSIRGGSGFSYGAGSRVLVVVNDLPLLSGDAGHVHWSFLPLENLAQVEIIKGASSVLYGSSALNGVINLRYKDPVDKPATSIRLFSGAYTAPERSELIWWDSPRWFAGASASHSRKIGNLDLSSSAYMFEDKGYREDEYGTSGRFNVNMKYRSKKVRGLSYSINTSGMILKQADFFLWQDADSGAYRQNQSGTSYITASRIYFDPTIRYFTKKENKHSINARYYMNVNEMAENENNNSRYNLMLGEYRYQHNFTENVHWTIGTSFNYSKVISNLYGDHTKTEAAAFTQLSATLFKKLKYNIGFRWEAYTLNDTREHSNPVFRTGANYQLAPHTFLRVSFGQGYRFPSIAEKYTATQVGTLRIFPNPDLEAETAWSTDAGVIQAYQLGTLKGYIDLSVFRSTYTNMIEFTFGLYPPEDAPFPTIDDVGFKALNVGKAQITGSEIIINAEKKFGAVTASANMGYTFIHPIDLSIPADSTKGNILKYRHRHSAKGDFSLSWKRLSAGATVIRNSFMERVDSVFIHEFWGNQILPGYPDYRNSHQKGYTTLDLRFSYDIWRETSLSVICKNLMNVEYMGRPGDIQPHRNITLQFLMKF